MDILSFLFGSLSYMQWAMFFRGIEKVQIQMQHTSPPCGVVTREPRC